MSNSLGIPKYYAPNERIMSASPASVNTAPNKNATNFTNLTVEILSIRGVFRNRFVRRVLRPIFPKIPELAGLEMNIGLPKPAAVPVPGTPNGLNEAS